MKTLLIDDEPFVLKLLAHQLNQIGLDDLLLCESALKALEMLGSSDPTIELIFCDLQMPAMDGVQFVRNLVKLNYRGGLILVSGEDTRILQSAEKLARARGLRVVGTLSKPVHKSDLQALLSRSETSEQFTPRETRRQYSSEEVLHAIDAGELVNHYQPKVSLSTRRVSGVETLVRWKHPQDGLVFPDQFVPIAEESGLINQLTRVVLVNAMNDHRSWRDAKLDLAMAINVSMDDLCDLDLPDFIANSAAETGISLSRLTLEITESRLMSDPLTVMDILTRLRLKGVALSIDDFGTGHSSLSQLRDLPFNELKVDRGFVHGVNQDTARRSILDASLRLARELNLDTVGEGVEDADDWNHLVASGCVLAQGWFISRAMPSEAIPGWIVEWNRVTTVTDHEH
jgi:EAL domain-containing protein (putative c-di-GMP-specific phosphodiesterase class I)